MTKQDFIKQYCKLSDITEDFFNSNFVALKCNCDAEDCQGWAAVCNNPISIKTHLKLYVN